MNFYFLESFVSVKQIFRCMQGFVFNGAAAYGAPEYASIGDQSRAGQPGGRPALSSDQNHDIGFSGLLPFERKGFYTLSRPNKGLLIKVRILHIETLCFFVTQLNFVAFGFATNDGEPHHCAKKSRVNR